MTGEERDLELDDWLQGRRALLRGDAALMLEPPAELDHLVIDRAHRELQWSARRKPGFFRGSRFTAPFAIAATVVLSFTLVLEFNRYESSQAALRARAENGSASAITVRPVSSASADTAATLTESITAAAPGGAISAAGASVADASVRRARPAAPALASRRAEGRDDARVRRETDAPALEDKYAAADAAPPATAPLSGSLAAERAATASEAKSMRNAQSEPTDQPAPAAEPARSTAAAANSALRSASQWWRTVQQLKRAGRFAEAAEELTALHAAYPDFVAPGTSPQPTAPRPAAPMPAAQPESPAPQPQR